MRVARILKYLAYGVIVLGVLSVFKSYGLGAVKFWATILISVIIWCFLRVIANIAQIIYDIKSELLRILGNLERSSYRINASIKEIRDLVESSEANKK